MDTKFINIDKIGSAASRSISDKSVKVTTKPVITHEGDVIAVRCLSESVTYGNIELPSGRLAKINAGDTILGVLGKRRALKGFVGDIPVSVTPGDTLQLLNMGGVIGVCKGHHSSFSDAISVEVLGIVCKEDGSSVNIRDVAIPPSHVLDPTPPIIMVAGTCMNSGKTVAAAELIKQASKSGLKVVGAKLSGIACLRDTLQMIDHGASTALSFLDCGLPSTVDHDDLALVAKAIINRLSSMAPDLIVIELGDGIIGGYSVDTILRDVGIMSSISAFVFCASDYVGVVGGAEVLRGFGIEIDVVAGSVTDSQMGEDFVTDHFGLAAGNAKRDGKNLYKIVGEVIAKDQPQQQISIPSAAEVSI